MRSRSQHTLLSSVEAPRLKPVCFGIDRRLSPLACCRAQHGSRAAWPLRRAAASGPQGPHRARDQ
eukprot:6646669-Alexandrium_andersonii.AAC.1